MCLPPPATELIFHPAYTMNYDIGQTVGVLEERQGYTVFGDRHRWTQDLYEKAKSIALEHAKTGPAEPVCGVISNSLLKTFETLGDAIKYRNSEENNVWFHIIAVHFS